MSDFDLLVENFLRPREKVNFESLVAMVEEVLVEQQEAKLSLMQEGKSKSKGRRR